MTVLRLTDAGRTALADGTNRALNAIQLRSMQLGDGRGPGGSADDSRTALRSEKDSVALVGTTMVSGRLAVRGDFTPSEVYSVTEVGIIARIGGGGDEFLFAYWAVPAADAALANTAADTRLVVAAILDVTAAAAEINVTVSATITIGGRSSFVELTDTPAQIDADKYARGNNTATAIVWDQAPPVVATEGDLPTAAVAVQKTYAVANYNNTGQPAIAQAVGSQWRYYTPARDASDTVPGLVELATVAEAKAGTDTERAVTPAGLAAAVAAAAPVELFYSQTGTVLTSMSSGTQITLTESYTNFRFIEFIFRKTEAPQQGVRNSVKVLAAGIPSARDNEYELLVSGSSEVRAWAPSSTTMRLEGGDVIDALHAIIGHRAPSS